MTRAYRQDLTDLQTGRLTVLRKLRMNGKTVWECRCSCGVLTFHGTTTLLNGRSKSCGKCQYIDRTKGENALKRHPLFMLHHRMKRRCSNPLDKGFYLYGARGIKVCDRWAQGENGLSGLECFAIDMGPRPTKLHSIDRIDNDGDYAPENCRWATPKEQAQNKRTVPLYEHDGKIQSLAQWAEGIGLSRNCLYRRITKGRLTFEQALTIPYRARPHKRKQHSIGGTYEKHTRYA